MADNLTVRTDAGSPSAASTSEAKPEKSKLDQRVDSLRAVVSEKLGKDVRNNDDAAAVLKAILKAREARTERTQVAKEAQKTYEKGASAEQLQRGTRNDGISRAVETQQKTEHGLTREAARQVASVPEAPATLPPPTAQPITAEKGQQLAAQMLSFLMGPDGKALTKEALGDIKQRPATLPGDKSANANAQKASTPAGPQRGDSGTSQQQQPGQQSSLGQLVNKSLGQGQENATQAGPGRPGAETTTPSRPTTGDVETTPEQPPAQQHVGQFTAKKTTDKAGANATPQTPDGRPTTQPGNQPSTLKPAPEQSTTQPPAQADGTQSGGRPGQNAGNDLGAPGNRPQTRSAQLPQSRMFANFGAKTSGTTRQGATPGALPGSGLTRTAASTTGGPTRPASGDVAQSTPTNGSATAGTTTGPSRGGGTTAGPSRGGTTTGPSRPEQTPGQTPNRDVTPSRTRPPNGDVAGDTPAFTSLSALVDASIQVGKDADTTEPDALSELVNTATGKTDDDDGGPSRPTTGGPSRPTTDGGPSRPTNGDVAETPSQQLGQFVKTTSGDKAGTNGAPLIGNGSTPSKQTPVTQTPISQTPTGTQSQTPTRPTTGSATAFSPTGGATRSATPMGTEGSNGTRMSLRAAGSVRRSPGIEDFNLGGGLDTTGGFDGMNFNWDAFYFLFMSKYAKDEFKARQMMAELRDLMRKLAIDSIEARIALEEMNQAFEQAQAAMELAGSARDLQSSKARGTADDIMGRDPQAGIAGRGAGGRLDSRLADTLKPHAQALGLQADANGIMPIALSDSQLTQLEGIDPKAANQYRDLARQRRREMGRTGQLAAVRMARDAAPVGSKARGELEAQYRTLSNELDSIMVRANQNHETRSMLEYRSLTFNQALQSQSMRTPEGETPPANLYEAAGKPSYIGQYNLRLSIDEYMQRAGRGTAVVPAGGQPAGSIDRALMSTISTPEGREDLRRRQIMSTSGFVQSASAMEFEQIQLGVWRPEAPPLLRPYIAKPGTEPTPLQRNGQDLYEYEFHLKMTQLAANIGMPEPEMSEGARRARAAVESPNSEAGQAFWNEFLVDTGAPSVEAARSTARAAISITASQGVADITNRFLAADHRLATDENHRLMVTHRTVQGMRIPEVAEDKTNRQEELDRGVYASTSNDLDARKAREAAVPGTGETNAQDFNDTQRDDIRRRAADQGKHQRGLRDVASDMKRDQLFNSFSSIAGVADTARRDAEKAGAQVTAMAQRGAAEVDQRMRSLYAQSQGLLAQMIQILNIGRSR